MPLFNCRVLTSQGQIMHSRVEDTSRLACIRRLRRNGLTPISVTPIVRFSSKRLENSTKKARNIKPTANYNTKLKNRKNKKTQGGIWEKLNSDIVGGKKPSARDIRVFTQNLYLLKKANFNNIHALSTVIQTTENPRLRVILEDILAGVESR